MYLESINESVMFCPVKICNDKIVTYVFSSFIQLKHHTQPICASKSQTTKDHFRWTKTYNNVVLASRKCTYPSKPNKMTKHSKEFSPKYQKESLKKKECTVGCSRRELDILKRAYLITQRALCAEKPLSFNPLYDVRDDLFHIKFRHRCKWFLHIQKSDEWFAAFLSNLKTSTPWLLFKSNI